MMFLVQLIVLFYARAKIEKQLCKLYESIDDAIQGNSMRVKVEGLVKALTISGIAKNDWLIGFASKIEQAEKLQSELEERLEVVNNRNDEYMEKARRYIDSVLDKRSPTKNSLNPRTPRLLEPLRRLQQRVGKTLY